MNAVVAISPVMSEEPNTALSLALPETTDYPTWLAEGRRLATSKRHLDWLIGDWINFGREHFPDQIELALADVSDDPRNLKRIEKTARAFPPHLRHADLSFDHHAHVADLPTQEALPLLKEAERDHLPARQLRIRAMLRKVDTGQILPREDDAEDDALMALVRAWNRAPRSVREEFADMIAESHLSIIDPTGRFQ
jgi:hypothetical protein